MLAVREVDSPADSPIFRGGNFQSLGDTVPRGFLSAVPVSKNHAIPAGSSGHRQLAEWLTDPGNPLTSRVLVNRVWRHLFGKGLVRSVDYFGVHGDMPSHPKLLDFLALRMRVNDGWSLKKTARRMVMSHAYQMASTPNAKAAATDPDNHLEAASFSDKAFELAWKNRSKAALASGPWKRPRSWAGKVKTTMK